MHTNDPIHRVLNDGKHSNNILMKLDKHETYICINSISFEYINTFALLYTQCVCAFVTHDYTSLAYLGKFEILLTLLTSIEWACWYPMLYMSHDCLPLKPHAMTKTPWTSQVTGVYVHFVQMFGNLMALDDVIRLTMNFVQTPNWSLESHRTFFVSFLSAFTQKSQYFWRNKQPIWMDKAAIELRSQNEWSIVFIWRCEFTWKLNPFQREMIKQLAKLFDFRCYKHLDTDHCAFQIGIFNM